MKLVSRKTLEALASIHEADESSFSYEDFLKQYDIILKSSSCKYTEAYFQIRDSYLKDKCPPIEYINEGTSRAAYACLGGKCLKIATNEKGIAQNKQESKTFNSAMKYSCFTQLYDFDQKNGASLMTECCAKAEDADFQRLYNAPNGIESICNIVEHVRLQDFNIDKVIRHFKLGCKEDKEMLDALPPEDADREHLESMIAQTQWMIESLQKLKSDPDPEWKVLRDLLAFYEAGGRKELSPGDLQTIENWGLAIRNGKTVPVIIDAGLSDAIFLKYYEAGF